MLFKLCCLKSEIIEVQECAPRKYNLGNNPAGLSGVVQCFPPVLKVISPMLTITEEWWLFKLTQDCEGFFHLLCGSLSYPIGEEKKW